MKKLVELVQGIRLALFPPSFKSEDGMVFRSVDDWMNYEDHLFNLHAEKMINEMFDEDPD